MLKVVGHWEGGNGVSLREPHISEMHVRVHVCVCVRMSIRDCV